MKISIVTAVMNDHEHISETLSSVLDQHYPELEYIVIDGASTDGTRELIEQRRDELAYFVSEPDSGIYEAMNKGIAQATGEVIGIINSGDYYLPGALNLVAASFAAPGALEKIFWGDVHYEHLGRVRGFRPENRYRGAFAPHPSMFVPRQIYQKIGAYDETFRLLGDYDFMYRAVNKYGIAPLYCPQEIAYYREGGLSDRHIVACLQDELKVKIRYGQPHWQARTVYFLKLLKNLPRIWRSGVSRNS